MATRYRMPFSAAKPAPWLLGGILLVLMLGLNRSHAGDGVAPDSQSILLEANGLAVTTQDLNRELLTLTDAERQQIIRHPDQIKSLLRRIYRDKNMAGEAMRLGLDQDSAVIARLDSARLTILNEALRDRTLATMAPPDYTALAREHYLVRRDEFMLPERFQAAHILRKARCECERAEQLKIAEEALEKLRAGADFSELARQYSQDEKAGPGGDLGRWFTRDELLPSFADALVDLQPGGISGIVETPFGFHIIRLLAHEPAREQTFEEVAETIEQELRRSYFRDQLAERARAYLPGAAAQFNMPAIEALLRRD